jgi:hypothetical protein
MNKNKQLLLWSECCVCVELGTVERQFCFYSEQNLAFTNVVTKKSVFKTTSDELILAKTAGHTMFIKDNCGKAWAVTPLYTKYL